MKSAEKTEKPTLYLVDGSNYIFRAFYAITNLSNSKGFPTNAIYGFTTMLMKLLRERKPDYIAVAFDMKGPTFRHEAFENYKANRRPMPDALGPQIPFIKDVVRGFSIAVIEKEGVEADDVIGTLARRYAGQGMDVVIVSGDKDMLQLVSDGIIMIDTMKDKIYDRTAVKERFGVEPERVVEILGLMGDASDNIPGVPGVGPKGAQRLIEQFGTIDAALKDSHKIYNARIREALEKNAQKALMSRELALIQTDVDISVEIQDLRCGGPDPKVLGELFRELEFTSLLRDLDRREEALSGQYEIILTGKQLDRLAERLKTSDAFSIDILLTHPEPMRADILGLAFGVAKDEACYIPVGHEYVGAPQQLKIGDILEKISPFLSNVAIAKHGHDLKEAVIALANQEVSLRNLGCDTLVASYLLNPGQHGFELADICRENLSQRIETQKDLIGSGAKALPLPKVDIEKMRDYACRRVDAVSALVPILSEKILNNGLDHLLEQIEIPLISVLATMERHGVLLNTRLLASMSLEIEQLLADSEAKIYRLAGEKFNVNSPKQLQVILFEKKGLPRGKKTKEGYSTDVDVLTNLAKSYELPAEILAYRSMAKLKSTYIDALPLLVNSRTGRVHTTYNQTVTATGRLSSSNPNLQNIPIRTMEGKRIRQAFIAPEGWLIVSADYSQIELRVLAHLSEDRALVDAFASGEDIHARTASDVFGVFPGMVNADMRRQAKVINFGIIYGMSPFGLARELGISQKLAQTYIEGYFDKYSGVRSYLDRLLSEARGRGFVITLMDRRRYLPEINSSNVTVRQFAERMAVNTPIQGTAADLIKIAMLNIARSLTEKKLSAAMIMQVHDELVFEVPEHERDAVMEIVRREMEGVVKLIVPLKVDCAAGRNWDEAHG
ncbi:MAG: DNA polymerase I [Deltaproteobacteria bacterium]|nr:DNA polymerase I [Deltaproteobacteria bacterium]